VEGSKVRRGKVNAHVAPLVASELEIDFKLDKIDYRV